jgi:hypothetical protein
MAASGGVNGFVRAMLHTLDEQQQAQLDVARLLPALRTLVEGANGSIDHRKQVASMRVLGRPATRSRVCEFLRVWPVQSIPPSNSVALPRMAFATGCGNTQASKNRPAP